MFRTTYTLALFFVLSHTSSAGGMLFGQVGGGDMSGTTKTAERITQDHVQAQLDWRSYYLCRMAVRRHDPERVCDISNRPSAGDTR